MFKSNLFLAAAVLFTTTAFSQPKTINDMTFSRGYNGSAGVAQPGGKVALPHLDMFLTKNMQSILSGKNEPAAVVVKKEEDKPFLGTASISRISRVAEFRDSSGSKYYEVGESVNGYSGYLVDEITDEHVTLKNCLASDKAKCKLKKFVF